MNLIQFFIGLTLIVGVAFITSRVNWKDQLADLFILLRQIPFKSLLRRLLTLLAMLICLTAHSQTRRGEYNRVVTNRWSAKTSNSSQLTKWKNGTIAVTDKLILIDSATTSLQVYSIVKRSDISDFDYDDVPDAVNSAKEVLRHTVYLENINSHTP